MGTNFRNVQTRTDLHAPLARIQARDLAEQDSMAKYREHMKKYYYDPEVPDVPRATRHQVPDSAVGTRSQLHDAQYKGEIQQRVKALRPIPSGGGQDVGRADVGHVNEAMEGALGRIQMEALKLPIPRRARS